MTVPAAPLGVLTLDAAFPRIPGDLGCPGTYAYPVLFETVAGATPESTVHHRDNRLLPAFVAAGRRLADRGAVGIVTTCGFLARWQKELTAELPVPVATSALLQIAWLAWTGIVMLRTTEPAVERVASRAAVAEA